MLSSLLLFLLLLLLAVVVVVSLVRGCLFLGLDLANEVRDVGKALLLTFGA